PERADGERFSEAVVDEHVYRLRAVLDGAVNVLGRLLHPRVATADRAVLAGAAAQLMRLRAERLFAPRTRARRRLAELFERAGAATPDDRERIVGDRELRLHLPLRRVALARRARRGLLERALLDEPRELREDAATLLPVLVER